jgi:nucleoside-diphosphate-sugar epimerase
MNIIITGGNGFLGSNIVRKLLLHEHNVLVLSRNCNNIENLMPRVDYLSTDFTQIDQLESRIIAFAPDVVVHCAWNGGNNYNDVSSLSQFENVAQGIGLIDILGKLPKKIKFIGFGSFAEYGNLTAPAKEEDREQPINHYGLSKYALKCCSELLCERYNIDWAWVRPCYVYGPNDVSTRLIPTVINKLLRGDRVELDNCSKKIDYIFVEDFVNFVYSLIMNDANGVYNVCSGQQYDLKDVISKIGLLMNKASRINFSNTSTRTLTSSIICGDNSKVKNQSLITTLTDLDAGLMETIKCFKQKYEQ